MKEDISEDISGEIAAIFARAGIASALALGVSWPEDGRRWATQIFLGQPSLFDGQSVDAATVFDLASVTKVLVTTLCIHQLVCQGKLTFSDRLADIFPDIFDNANAHPAWRTTSIEQLLNHSSGLPAHRPYYEQLLTLPPSARQDALLRLIANEAPVYAAGHEHIYSDLGFMLLGFIVERLGGDRLDSLWRRLVAAKVDVEDVLFFPKERERERYVFAETGACPWSGKILAGTVHDDNCRALGGIAGHAGLFGTLGGVMAVCDWLIARWHGMGREAELLRQMCKPALGGSRCLGFDSPSGPDSASGSFFQAPSVGHLGFTGTSFWIDLRRRISVTLLTNHTLFSWDREEMRCFRREVYDCVMRRFEGRPTGRP
jgi:CubicO group peptidase (beta-lactamase class C family)